MSDGREALERVLAADPPYDLIITDLRMPRLGGRALAQVLHEHGARIPMVFTSGYLDADDDAQACALPGPLLRKPWRQADLLRALRDQLDRT